MILIMSEYDDNSSVYVTQWLLHYKIPFVRIDLEEKYALRKVCINNSNFDFVIEDGKGKEISMNDISAVWYRRGDLNLSMPKLNFAENNSIKKNIGFFLQEEKAVLENFFYKLMKKKPHIGTFGERAVNKIEVLYEASLLQIEIPSTFIASSKKEIHASPLNQMITKSIYEGFKIKINGLGNYTTYTEKVDKETMEDKFFPSLFQEEIKKEADIRSFYLDGKFYTMAIRSQCDDQTTTDFRKYLKGKNGNRLFPFKLPTDLENKLHLLMDRIGLNTGSIDLVFTKDGRFVFLEVNPVGQFGMTSYPCNYYLEKLIAHKLIEFSNN